jgi:hypothetical protein
MFKSFVFKIHLIELKNNTLFTLKPKYQSGGQSFILRARQFNASCRLAALLPGVSGRIHACSFPVSVSSIERIAANSESISSSVGVMVAPLN